ncbi:hypothetical protein SADUNF_Sadunf09G0128400 [Salix dunnii]|uniref:Uncharacterized protein n=1 Tax=Salix dunnii TaxID=1413687 RepID=A0A835MTR3_9ROSI|nr:hypothetical protein SADUNF_Sadunf09G0128400 [Salix dunnii]
MTKPGPRKSKTPPPGCEISHPNDIASADTAISNILCGSVKLFTTRCNHEQIKSTGGCIVEIIGEQNPDHFFVGTQDTDMRKNLASAVFNLPAIILEQVPGAPLIFGLRNALFLEPPSASTSSMPKILKKNAMLLKKRTKNLLETQETGGSSDENGDPKNESLEIETKRYNGRKGMSIKDRLQIKRMKAKGICTSITNKEQHLILSDKDVAHKVQQESGESIYVQGLSLAYADRMEEAPCLVASFWIPIPLTPNAPRHARCLDNEIRCGWTAFGNAAGKVTDSPVMEHIEAMSKMEPPNLTPS